VLIATVKVNEVDVADVKAGQEATVTFDAAVGLAIPGKVRWVSPNSVTTGNVRTYDVEIDLAVQNPKLRPGMTASADIATVKLDDALLIPKTAVRVDGTTKYVTVVKPDASQEKRTVTTGRSDGTRVQVLSGLKTGEKILTSFAAPVAAKPGGIMPGRPPAGAGGN
jgi:RND family efflux transporter MFP subunit